MTAPAKKSTSTKPASHSQSRSSGLAAKNSAQIEKIRTRQGNLLLRQRRDKHRLDEHDEQIEWLVDAVDWLTRPTPTYVWVLAAIAGVISGLLWTALLAAPAGTAFVVGLAVGCLVWAATPRKWSDQQESEEGNDQEEREEREEA